MATALPLPVTAAQVGTYFVGRYFQMLQNQPYFVHQFYSEASKMLRIDGNTKESASSMMQIHHLVMSLNYLELEINSAHSLDSWNSGVLVMVSGSVRIKDLDLRKNFVETFFLAPQENGYFVLNDVFQYVGKEQTLQHPLVFLPQSNIDSKLNLPSIVREQGVETQTRQLFDHEENSQVNDYKHETMTNGNFILHSNCSLQGNVDSAPGHLESLVEEPAVEYQEHTYASILKVAKAKPADPVMRSHNKTVSPSVRLYVPKSSNVSERSDKENVEDVSWVEDEVEEPYRSKSVYVKNIPTNMAAWEIAEEFKKFGKLSQEGVAIRSRKEVEGCYAFVEFEDISGVQNATKASVVEIRGHSLLIEGRRPNRNLNFRGGDRGRGRMNYMMESTRGKFSGRGFNRGGNYNGQKVNGFYRVTSRKEKA